MYRHLCGGEMLSLQRGAPRLCDGPVLQLTSGHAELCGFCFPLGSAITVHDAWRPYTIFLFTVHWLNIRQGHAPFFVCVAEDGRTGFFWFVVVVPMLSGVSEWGWEATAPRAKSCMIVWIIPTREKNKNRHPWHLRVELMSSRASPPFQFDLLNKHLLWMFWK